MTRSQMQAAVIQYTILITIGMILSQEISRNAYNDIWEDPVLKNYTATWKSGNNSGNATILRNNTSTMSSMNPSEDPESFYSSKLPINVFVLGLISPLLYYWQICLERFFPTRPRGVEIDYSSQKEKMRLIDLNEDQEEEVVKRWIAQGKVRRSSISWWNTFVKWVLNVTLGTIFFLSLEFLLDGFVRWKSFGDILASIKSITLVSFFAQFLTLGPVGSLIGFIIVPATKRIVFNAATNAVQSVFVSAFLRLAVPWIVSTQLVQSIMGNATEGVMSAQRRGGVGGMDGRLIGGPDEL